MINRMDSATFRLSPTRYARWGEAAALDGPALHAASMPDHEQETLQ
jgi:hypothetical protein